jgi:hypothetical protein
MDSYEHSYETQSSVLLLGPQKPCHFTKGLVLLLMHDRKAYKQEIFDRFRRQNFSRDDLKETL